MAIDGGRPEGYVTTPDQMDAKASTIMLVKEAGDWLEKTYPGWAWALQPDDQGGVMYLRALKLHGHWGCVMRLVDLIHDPERKKLKTYAGEILERFGMPRRGFDYSLWTKIPRDVAGDCVPIIHDKEKRKQRSAENQQLGEALNNGTAELVLKDDSQGTRHVMLKRTVK